MSCLGPHRKDMLLDQRRLGYTKEMSYTEAEAAPCLLTRLKFQEPHMKRLGFTFQDAWMET
jgi:hypothetical protein